MALGFLTALVAFLNPLTFTTSLRGTGPPLVFSTGLFNTMPSFIYSNLLTQLSRNFTIITTSEPVRKSTIEEISKGLGIESVALFIHSSFHPDVLESPFLRGVVFCDPITVPAFNFDDGFIGTELEPSCDVMVIRAEKAYVPANATNTIPELNSPTISTECYFEHTFPGVGHPDLLDDAWADLASYTNIWATAYDEVLPFETWARERIRTADRDKRIWSANERVKSRRALYRERVSELTSGFFLT
mgnify:FL=1